MRSNGLRIVGFSKRSKGTAPAWLVRRAVEILLNNKEQLTIDEIANIVLNLMKEADSKVLSKYPQCKMW